MNSKQASTVTNVSAYRMMYVFGNRRTFEERSKSACRQTDRLLSSVGGHREGQGLALMIRVLPCARAVYSLCAGTGGERLTEMEERSRCRCEYCRWSCSVELGR